MKHSLTIPWKVLSLLCRPLTRQFDQHLTSTFLEALKPSQVRAEEQGVVLDGVVRDLYRLQRQVEALQTVLAAGQFPVASGGPRSEPVTPAK
jgi:hypothetical protein